MTPILGAIMGMESRIAATLAAAQNDGDDAVAAARLAERLRQTLLDLETLARLERQRVSRER